MKKSVVLILSASICLGVFAQDLEKKTVTAVRINQAPVIDGDLTDPIWKQAQGASGFFNLEPESGGPAPVTTEFKFLYDDVSIYVAVRMNDPEPFSIRRQLGKRDDDDVVSDWVGIWFNPYDDGANELSFVVTAAGVQVDMKYGSNGQDASWNPVWKSAVTLDDQGWTAEMEIPFSQIRFPKSKTQRWGVNMARYRASVREVYTWTLLDKTKENFAQQAGWLLGLQDIETPLRLSFTPYAATIVEHYPYNVSGKSNFSRAVRGGVDLKYGINESFTLDLTLIPDFGQVQSDNAVLNLSPFEIRHDEHRPFFTEGTELLSKAGLFYTRRIGEQPMRYYEAMEDDVLAPGDSLISNPDANQLINATKITGQTSNGWGLGFFNATTAPMHAVIQDSVGVEREYITNPLTNYNLLVVSKNLNNGSEISLVNTNVQRFADGDDSLDFNDANVIGFESTLKSKNGKWSFGSYGAYDEQQFLDSISTGFKYGVSVSENEGSVQYGFGQNAESEHFNPNDMGYLQQPNEFSHFAYLILKTINPIWNLNHGFMEVSATHSQLYQPRVYSSLSMNINYDLTFKNYYSMGGGFYIKPVESRDYHETRTQGRFYLVPPFAHGHIWLSSNFNNPFSMSGWVGTSTTTNRGTHWYGFGVSPRWRASDRFFVSYDLDVDVVNKDNGFADKDGDDIIFGRRDQSTVVNTVYSQFILSPEIESDLRLRYYRSSVEYAAFFDVLSDGSLSPKQWEGDYNTVFNALTIDAVLTWRFAPGSEVNLTWKNAIFTSGDDPSVDFFDDLTELRGEPQNNSISIKFLYYVDYWNLKHHLE